ncbi:MAG TPA: hypothetical protein VIU93_07490 [Gallionellaceae bacterium]
MKHQTNEEREDMLIYAIVIFAIGAVGGLFLASQVLTDKLAPWPISIVHALLGATGIILLIAMTVMNQGTGRLSAALTLFVIAALGGFFLASIHVRGKIAPKAIVLLHATIAVLGFLTLLSIALGL